MAGDALSYSDFDGSGVTTCMAGNISQFSRRACGNAPIVSQAPRTSLRDEDIQYSLTGLTAPRFTVHDVNGWTLGFDAEGDLLAGEVQTQAAHA